MATAHERRQHERERDEGEVAHDEVRAERAAAPRVRSRTLVRSSTVTRASDRDRPGQLAVADVDREDGRDPPAQQDVGEPAGAGTGVERVPARDVEAERVERADQLVRPAGHVVRSVGALADGDAGRGRPPGSPASSRRRRRARTRPSSTSARACSRERASPRCTSSASSRRRATTGQRTSASDRASCSRRCTSS